MAVAMAFPFTWQSRKYGISYVLYHSENRRNLMHFYSLPRPISFRRRHLNTTQRRLTRPPNCVGSCRVPVTHAIAKKTVSIVLTLRMKRTKKNIIICEKPIVTVITELSLTRAKLTKIMQLKPRMKTRRANFLQATISIQVIFYIHTLEFQIVDTFINEIRVRIGQELLIIRRKWQRYMVIISMRSPYPYRYEVQHKYLQSFPSLYCVLD